MKETTTETLDDKTKHQSNIMKDRLQMDNHNLSASEKRVESTLFASNGSDIIMNSNDSRHVSAKKVLSDNDGGAQMGSNKKSGSNNPESDSVNDPNPGGKLTEEEKELRREEWQIRQKRRRSTLRIVSRVRDKTLQTEIKERNSIYREKQKERRSSIRLTKLLQDTAIKGVESNRERERQMKRQSNRRATINKLQYEQELNLSIMREKEELARIQVEEARQRDIKQRKADIRKNPEIWTRVYEFLPASDVIRGTVLCKTFATSLPEVVKDLPFMPKSLSKSDEKQFNLNRFYNTGRIRMYNGEALGMRKLSQALIRWYHKCTKLSQLDFQWVSLGTDGANYLSKAIAAGALRTMQELNLRACQIGAVGCGLISSALSAGVCPRLENLDLNGNNIQDDGAASLAQCLQSGLLNRLKCLDLRHNKIGNRGGRGIAAVIRRKTACPHIESVNLRYNSMTSLGLRSLDQGFSVSNILKY